jgi:hypothetical protein
MIEWIKKNYLLVIIVVIAVACGLAFFVPKIWTENASLVGELTAWDFYKTIGGATLLVALLQLFLSRFIKHQYDRVLEEYRYSIKVREQAAKVADFLALAKWKTGTEGQDFDSMAYSLSLWLPAELLRELKVCCLGGVDEEKIHDLLLQVRQHLLKEKAGVIARSDILFFVKQN